MPIIGASHIFHNNEKRIKLQFDNYAPLNKLIKSIKDARWSRTHKSWHIPVDEKLYSAFKKALPEGCSIEEIKSNYKANTTTAEVNKIPQAPTPINVPSSQHKILPADLSDANLKTFQAYIQHLQLKAYSPSTIRTYKNEFGAFLQTLGNNPAKDFTTQRVKDYLQYCYTVLKLSENSIHSRINALKFYYEQVLKKEKFLWEIPRPKKPMKLPRFFNQDEIASIIKAASNLKHKVMLMLAYSGGLRVSEVVSLKTRNIDSRRMYILIENAKGKKDRIVTLSPVLLIMLREYWNAYKPLQKGFLFAGQYAGEPYSTRSLQLVLDAAKRKAGIIKQGSVHALRHSFATHLLDKGTDVTMIMKLLGHNDIKTTLRYLHVTNRDMLQIISPLDNLKL